MNYMNLLKLFSEGGEETNVFSVNVENIYHTNPEFLQLTLNPHFAC